MQELNRTPDANSPDAAPETALQAQLDAFQAR